MKAYKKKNYIKKFYVGSYSYVSCSDGYFSNYKTTYQLYAEVPPDFDMPFIRNPSPQTRTGSFTDTESLGGTVDGWNYELPSELSASAEASGHNPYSNERHHSRAESTTESNADVVNVD